MPAVTNGAELVKRLKATGTPDSRLAPARAKLREVHADHGKVASADEVVAALEAAYGPTHMTVVKAKAIREAGEWKPPGAARAAAAIEDMLADSGMAVSDGTAVGEAPRPPKVERVLSDERIEDEPKDRKPAGKK